MNKPKNKDLSSLEMNQSQSLSIMMSNNLNNSTKDYIYQQKQNKFNIANHPNGNKIEFPNNNNMRNNVIYNIINVDNINNINNNKKNLIANCLNNFSTNEKIITIKEEKDEFSEREKKLFEKEIELTNKQNLLNNKILELIQKNRR